ncbi:glycosyl hydrolase family 65 protein, partial [Phenylobacterium sp.]|uniref:glycosyl hydrolase family 65 protein n=1 Tax=Phenylobacterium sp. TaxID=1871053 RepID=UPI002F3E95F1
PVDVLIGRERTQASQVVKQADVVALIALLPEEFSGAMAETNFRYYEPRCGHGSSLSPAMHALVAARVGDTDMALSYLHDIVAFDPDPAAAGGVRIAGVGGIWQAIVMGFGGLDLSGDILGIEPKLPAHLRSLSYHVRWRGRLLAVRIAEAALEVTLVEGGPIDIRMAGATGRLTPGQTVRSSLRQGALV